MPIFHVLTVLSIAEKQASHFATYVPTYLKADRASPQSPHRKADVSNRRESLPWTPFSFLRGLDSRSLW